MYTTLLFLAIASDAHLAPSTIIQLHLRGFSSKFALGNILKERKAIKNSKEKLVKLLDEPAGIIKKKKMEAGPALNMRRLIIVRCHS